MSPASASCQVAAYYFPNYHVDPRNEKVHGHGWTEWELTRRARPRYPGHHQPRVPLWGYEDESDPAVFARKIAAAADHALTAFIFDWYYYDDGPFLERGLEQGYLQAPNRDRLQFALMWANHDWTDIHPRGLRQTPSLLYPGKITPATWEKLTDYVIARYFPVPSYWKLAGKPYFSIYELSQLLASFGSVAKTRQALDRFRAKTRRAGFADLHLNAIVWNLNLLPGEQGLKNPQELLDALGFDSLTSYVWIHHVPLPHFPVTPYAHVFAEMQKFRAAAAGSYRQPYFPNVTMGWDSSPRTVQSDTFENTGYPFMPMLGENTPAAFRAALADAKAFLDPRPPEHRILTLNAWNEWTEGSYLEPDTVTGLGYLQAIRDTFR